MSADVIKHNDLTFNYEINDFLQKTSDTNYL